MHQLATRSKCYLTCLCDIQCNGSLKFISMYWIQMNLQFYFGHLFIYFGHLFCEQFSRTISFSHCVYCIIDHVIKVLPFCYFLVCLEMHFVGNGDCIENDLLALSYQYLLKNVIFAETSQLKCHRPIVQNKRL